MSLVIDILIKSFYHKRDKPIRTWQTDIASFEISPLFHHHVKNTARYDSRMENITWFKSNSKSSIAMRWLEYVTILTLLLHTIETGM
jgi:hypothetical protein